MALSRSRYTLFVRIRSGCEMGKGGTTVALFPSTPVCCPLGAPRPGDYTFVRMLKWCVCGSCAGVDVGPLIVDFGRDIHFGTNILMTSP